ESQVSSLGVRVSGINDARDDVASVRATLASVQDALGRALAVAQQLTVNGQPIDVGALDQRIASLEGFRDGLREPDGNLLDGARLHDDLRQATASLVTGDQLAAALAGRAGGLSQQDLQALSDQITASVRAEMDVRLTQLSDSIRAETSAQLGGVDAAVSRAIAD